MAGGGGGDDADAESPIGGGMASADSALSALPDGEGRGDLEQPSDVSIASPAANAEEAAGPLVVRCRIIHEQVILHLLRT